ncbi:hypothetical protein [Janthinobacterium psychrotolerans]|uniref:Uncharacterized protein n=1 Tax=Janthinobacterium psychrotolerans TaxID=1747903 RepID=A0A1A7C7S4_9BURK|nr:hypothetical protein [Janthinobacterium psychrotolerans]OBV41079.1 hypothetical protein ASR47_102350 [Janthinobacterium psychrotolerans]
MAAKEDPRLTYPAAPALRASLRVAGDSVQVPVVPAKAGDRYDICLPTGNQRSARELYAEMNARVVDSAASPTGELLIGLGETASDASEWYLMQIKGMLAKYSKAMQEVAADFSKTGKYTAAHAAKVLEARRALEGALKDAVPAISFYRTVDASQGFDSITATERLSADVDAMSELSGRPLRNLERQSLKRINNAIDYSMEAPVIIDSKLAQILKKVDKILVAVELAPAVGHMLTAKTVQEQQKAAIEMSAAALSMAADRVVAAETMALCVGFGVVTGGWGFLACGVGAMTLGLTVGYMAEEQMKKLIPLALDAPGTLP